MSTSAERAAEVMRAHLGDDFTEGKVVAQPIGSDGILWIASWIDSNGMPMPGAVTIIGPDERVWVLSSNPGIHDCDLGVRLLEVAYRLKLEVHLGPDQFSTRVAEITARRSEDVRAFELDLTAGSLRSPRDKYLP